MNLLKRFLSLEQRVKARLEKYRKIKDGHWYWTGGIGSSGYGLIGIENKTISVHRAAYIVYNNLKFKDAVIDQILHRPPCYIKECFNPEHLYNGTSKDNAQDTVESNDNVNKNKTHCPAGHKYDDDNTYIYKTGRYCKKCRQKTDREWHAKNRLEKKGGK
jgi:hypothetical protein